MYIDPSATVCDVGPPALNAWIANSRAPTVINHMAATAVNTKNVVLKTSNWLEETETEPRRPIAPAISIRFNCSFGKELDDQLTMNNYEGNDYEKCCSYSRSHSCREPGC